MDRAVLGLGHEQRADHHGRERDHDHEELHEVVQVRAPSPEDDENGETGHKRPRKPKVRTVYGQGEIFPAYLSNTQERRVTIRIDSKLLAEAESEDPTKTRQALAEELRKIVSTVGKRGEPGEHVRCVVSVAMLTEGWDANNVTHILGLRAFGSQLLCEQVVGRGLRRMDYVPEPDGSVRRNLRILAVTGKLSVDSLNALVRMATIR